MIYFSKTARNFFTIYSLPKIDNISFRLNLVSQLAALVCQLSVHRNNDRRKQLIGRHFGKSFQDMTILDVIYLQNGSKFLHDTFCRQSRQYSLSHEPSQPIGRAGLSAWRSYKQREKKTVDRAKSGPKLIWHSIRWYISQKQLNK